jgi:hypothetical protein
MRSQMHIDRPANADGESSWVGLDGNKVTEPNPSSLDFDGESARVGSATRTLAPTVHPVFTLEEDSTIHQMVEKIFLK